MAFICFVSLWKDFLKLLTVSRSLGLCDIRVYQWIIFPFYVFRKFHNFCYVYSFCLYQLSSSFYFFEDINE
jgi:hypothetical protein